ncbi:DUF488 domain-containing protein [Parasedimentitalea psychrophila]|uniref:DUF488 domain-containing protein n=1 Tax=Parasedimentitalea psychrophila TaxID=2997337 RepID=A0A9Y2L4R5_9RHOB|nr:DUF488 domain-containing protein [Parasedimentitalea psychrophila]WIY27382.1 DUF488 domain-containing protein [Parasedimentitalea psychrophila]
MVERLKIFTIGHSTQTFESFVKLLKTHSITAIGDVRSSPYSRHAPQFNTDALKMALKESEIAYVFLGKELGARSDDSSCYVGNAVSYEKLAQTSLFQNGIKRVVDGSARYRVALMCSERDPTECHRTILVSKVLEERGAKVNHILGSGQLESHRDTMLRVLDILGTPRGDMLDSQDELISQAYEGREKQIAYRREG